MRCHLTDVLFYLASKIGLCLECFAAFWQQVWARMCLCISWSGGASSALRTQVLISLSELPTTVCSSVSPSSPFSLFRFWQLLLYACYTLERGPSFFFFFSESPFSVLSSPSVFPASWRGLRSGPPSLCCSFRVLVTSTFVQYDLHIL